MSVRSSRPLIQVTIWQCGSCLRRSLATTTSRQIVGPESPRYIDIPQPRQPSKPDRPRIKGILPIPRRIFGQGNAKDLGLRKADEAAIAQKTKLPARPRQHVGAHAELQAYKTRMADTRRQSLREGLMSMRDRQMKFDKQTRERVQRRHAERKVLTEAPEREDERLTRPSVDPAITAYLGCKVLPDPHREQRLAEMKKRQEGVEANRREQRGIAMQALYMNARDFIVDEKGLDEALETAFGTDETPVGFGPYKSDDSIWAYGPQMGTFGMLKKSQPKDFAGSMTEVLNAENTKKRLQTMAEELTGGKMDDPNTLNKTSTR